MSENDTTVENVLDETVEEENVEQIDKKKKGTEKSRSKKAELEKAKEERDEYLNALMRERADFENYKKRNATVVSQSYANGIADAACAILPVIDNFERALKVETADTAYMEGVCLVHRQLIDVLKTWDVTEIEAQGCAFDPNFHDAVMQEEAEDGMESGIVKEVLMKGYKKGDRVLRHSMVKVTS